MAIRWFFIKIHVCDKVVVCGQSVLTILFDVYISHLLCSTVLVYRLIENTQCVYNINLVFFVDTKEGFHVMDHMNYIATDRISKLPDHLQQHTLLTFPSTKLFNPLYFLRDGKMYGLQFQSWDLTQSCLVLQTTRKIWIFRESYRTSIFLWKNL